MAGSTIARPAARGRATIGLRPLVMPLVLCGIALLPLLLSLAFLSEPMEQDEGVYFTVARHGWPYGDVFDHKPPVVYGWYKLALLANGGEASVEPVRLLAAVSLSIAALAVTWTASMLFDRKTGVIAGVLMGLAATNQYLQFNANSEVFLLAPLTLSAAAFTQGWRANSLGWYALSGALAGIAAMTKSVAVLQLLALAGVLVWASAMQLSQWRQGLRASACLLAAGIATIVVAAAPFVVAGRGSEFWYANVTYNLAYGAQVNIDDKLFALADIDRFALIAGLYLWVPAVIGAVLLCRRGPSMAAALLISGGVAAFVGASATGREYPHYLIPLLPFACILAAFAYERMTAEWHRARARLHAEALTLALVVPAIFAIVPLYVLDIEAVHLRKYHQGPNARRAIQNEDVAARVRALAPGGTLFVLGDEAQLYALSGLAPSTHHLRPVSDAAVDRATFGWTMAELEAAPPNVVVDAGRLEMGAGLLGRESQTVELDVPPGDRARFDAFLREHYRHAEDVAYATIWLRK